MSNPKLKIQVTLVLVWLILFFSLYNIFDKIYFLGSNCCYAITGYDALLTNWQSWAQQKLEDVDLDSNFAGKPADCIPKKNSHISPTWGLIQSFYKKSGVHKIGWVTKYISGEMYFLFSLKSVRGLKRQLQYEWIWVEGAGGWKRQLGEELLGEQLKRFKFSLSSNPVKKEGKCWGCLYIMGSSISNQIQGFAVKIEGQGNCSCCFTWKKFWKVKHYHASIFQQK